MSDLIPFNQFIGTKHKLNRFIPKKGTFVVWAGDVPQGVVFDLDSFISFLGVLDTKFQDLSGDPVAGYNNPAGELIDAIEDRLPLKEEFIERMKKTHGRAKGDWVPWKEVKKHLHVSVTA